MAEKKSKDESEYAPPATQVDLERRLASGNRSDRVLSTADSYVPDESVDGRELLVEGNDTSAYVNVDPIYQNYANDTEAPMRAEDGPEADLEAVVHGEAVVTPEGVQEADENDPAAVKQTGPASSSNEERKAAAEAEAEATEAKNAEAKRRVKEAGFESKSVDEAASEGSDQS